jgi:hypothetical protein
MFFYADSKFANENLFFYGGISQIPKISMFNGSTFNGTTILQNLSKMMINENGSEEALPIKTIVTEIS